jgi:hypothetical protein
MNRPLWAGFLIPVHPSADEQRRAAVARLRRFREGKQLKDLSLVDLRDQGRKR